jgi:hypothetical protein
MAKGMMNPLFGAMGGKIGNLVLVRQGDGTVSLRERAVPRDPQTPAQVSGRAHLAAASRLWGQLTEAERDAWRAYAQGLSATAATPSLVRPPRPQALFVGLTTKWLQVHNGGSPPALPPTEAFYGDGIAVTVSAISGGVRFTASGPNSGGVVTELLLQRLASPGRAGQPEKYRTQRFVAFGSGSLSIDVTAPSGTTLAAVRFVRAGTGQASALVPVGRIQVN